LKLTVLALTLASAASAQPLAGLWDATVVSGGLQIPFRMEFAGDSAAIRGSFFNGDDKVTSNGGQFSDGHLVLNFDYYAAKLDATFKDGVLDGTYTRAGRPAAFHARRFAPSPLTEADVPPIAGLWEIPVKSPKGELAWRFVVRQAGPEVSAAILRVDGDTGSLTGTYRDGKFVLSHFSGARPMLLEVSVTKDGTLELLENGRTKMTAVRSAAARAQGLPEPTDPSRHTTVQDPTVPFRFSAPDLNGRVISEKDFQNKVVMVAIGGSWCPNCHDEAPFLEEMYKKYHARGLEVVALSFEEADQLKDPARLRAFIKQYGIEYTVLLAGETSELHAKLPQAVNLNAWPTTFFLGRDGLVKSVHAGFAGRASGSFHDELRHETEHLIEGLLADTASK
jgi:thiol-disulfide isomerase/thioredoxin